MAAAITDKFTYVGAPGTITSLSAPGKALAATSINIGSATNWPTTSAVFFTIRTVNPSAITTANPSGLVAGTQTFWKGTLSGTTISNLQLKYGTDQVYTAGVNTQVFITLNPYQNDSIIDGILAQHDQAGGHANITATGYTQSSGTFSIPTNAIDANELSASAIKLGYGQITSSFTTASTTVVQATGLTATVTIPAGSRSVKITAWTSFLTSSGGAALVTMSIWDGAVVSGTLLAECLTANAAASQGGSGTCIAVVTPAAGAKTYNVGLKVGSNTGQITASATSPAFILVEAI